MKHYNIQNYIRYKNDVEETIKNIPLKEFHEYSRNELVTTFLPLVENLARKFATSQQASGVMAITDLIQEGSLNLIKAIDRIDWPTIQESEDAEKSIKSFLSKRIHADDIYQCMLDLHDSGRKIVITQLALWLECSARTIHRNMSEELKREKELLNKQL